MRPARAPDAWYCLALALAALVLSNPIALGAVAVAVIGAGVFAGAGRQMRVALMLSVPLALAIAVINALVSPRRPDRDRPARATCPILGNTQVTLEATAYGAHPRAPRRRADPVRRAVHRGRRPRRGAVAVPSRVVPLRAHGDSGHPAGAAAGCATPDAWLTRSAAARSPADARGADARGHRRRARSRARRRGRARGQGVRRREAAGSQAARSVPLRSPVRRSRQSWWLRWRSSLASTAWRRSWHTRPCTRLRARRPCWSPPACSRVRGCRSWNEGGSSSERRSGARARDVHLRRRLPRRPSTT